LPGLRRLLALCGRLRSNSRQDAFLHPPGRQQLKIIHALKVKSPHYHNDVLGAGRLPKPKMPLHPVSTRRQGDLWKPTYKEDRKSLPTANLWMQMRSNLRKAKLIALFSIR
jgi:hypothetical protein